MYHNNVIQHRYIAAVTNTSGQAEIERAKNVLLHSNDILEAFGNAKVILHRQRYFTKTVSISLISQ